MTMSDVANTSTDKELELLEHISTAGEDDGSRVQQRDLAHAIGMSLGMTNAILKRLARKGYLTIRKVNNRNIAYAVTPEGIDAIARRSYRYLRRTVGNIVRYKEAIEALVRDLHRHGVRRLTLHGESDLAFIVEHFCMRYGVGFSHLRAAAHHGDGDARPGDGHADADSAHFTLHSESVPPPADAPTETAEHYLAEVLRRAR